jgi:hypothetical protein
MPLKRFGIAAGSLSIPGWLSGSARRCPREPPWGVFLPRVVSTGQAGPDSSGAKDTEFLKEREALILGKDWHVEREGGGCDPRVVDTHPETAIA